MDELSLDEFIAELINKQYSQANLVSTIQKLLLNKSYTQEYLSTFDEIHVGGQEHTIELARAAGIKKGMKLLDIGCGLGGPARTLASKFGCTVLGIDLNLEFYKTAVYLTNLVGLNDRITFKHGNALTMSFNNEIFDVIWIQHVLMNIEHKNSLLALCHQILKPNGKIILHEICNGSISPILYPVIWANKPNLNFLLSSNELRQIIHKKGFKELYWIDVSEKAIKWYSKIRTARKSDTSKLNELEIIFGPNFSKKASNVRKNLIEDRIAIYQGIFVKSE